MRRALIVGWVAICVLLGLLLSRLHRVPMSNSPPAQGVYVWQQQWSDSTWSSLTNHVDDFAHCVLLATEIQWNDGQPSAKHIDLPLSALRTLDTPLGMAIRMGGFSGSYTTHSPAARLLAGVIQDRLNRWRDAGVEPSEIQIDFDCPESKLDHYRQWLEQLRPAADGVKLTFTALPAWLDQPAFQPLAEASDGFVLQVHFYQVPKHPSEAVTLCDPDLALRSVMAAARIQIPFRVALPTYGYRVYFGHDNSVQGIAAEGSTRDWTDARTARELRADAGQMAALVKSWSMQRPLALEGIIWFRMPVPGDTLNWSWPTLAAVMEGRAPTRGLEFRTVSRDSGLVELVAANVGEADLPLPAKVVADWQNGTLIAADGINSFAITNRGQRSLSLSLSQPKTLTTDEELTVAWLRFEQPTEVTIDY